MIIFVLVDLVSWSSNKQIFVTTRSLTINYGVDNHMKFVCAISQQREESLARRTAKCTTYRNSWPQKLSPPNKLCGILWQQTQKRGDRSLYKATLTRTRPAASSIILPRLGSPIPIPHIAISRTCVSTDLDTAELITVLLYTFATSDILR